MDFESLHNLINNQDSQGVAEFVKNNNLEIVDGKIFAKDRDFAKKQAEFYDRRQLIKKILLNS